MNRRFGITLSIILAISAIIVPAIIAEEYMQVHAAIDVRTNLGDGRYSLSEIAEAARKGNIRIIIATDGFLNRWQYGMWPLRNIIKKTVETKSVTKFGIWRYLNRIKSAQMTNPDMILVSSVEVSPFYYWDGSPFGNRFNIRDWHRHLLVIGLDSVIDYRNLPVVGNGLSLAKPFSLSDLLNLLFILFLLWIGAGAVRSALDSRNIYERKFGIPTRYLKSVGIFIVIAAVLLLVSNFPFRSFKYDQYHGDLSAAPYQNLIDYVNERGGTIFWAHPEAKNIDKVGTVDIETEEHSDLLLSTSGYTGFAIFHEGYDRVGAPGRLWDEVLKDYCKGIRPSPAWAIGALAFEKSGDLEEYMGGLRTVFLLSHFTKADVVDALKEGRMYVSKGPEAANFVLDKFSVADPSGANEKTMGQTIATSGRPHIIISGRFMSGDARSAAITIIRNGDIIKTIDATAPFAIDFEDKDAVNSNKYYYRAEIRSEGLIAVTNPIFVSRK